MATNTSSPDKPEILYRSRLVSFVTNAGPLMFIGAGVGFGKSILLKQVAQALTDSGIRGETITFPESAKHMEELVAQALATLWNDNARVQDVLEGNFKNLTAGSQNSPVFLLLDQYENVRSAKNDEWLSTLAKSLPDGSRTLIAGRFAEDTNLRLLNNRHNFSFVDTEDMRFDQDEIHQFLPGLNPEIKILGQINGWPAGIKILNSHLPTLVDHSKDLDVSKVQEDLKGYFQFFKIGESACSFKLIEQLTVTPHLTRKHLESLLDNSNISFEINHLNELGLLIKDGAEKLSLFPPFYRFMLDKLLVGEQERISSLIRKSTLFFIGNGKIERARSVLELGSDNLKWDILEAAGGWILDARFGSDLFDQITFPPQSELSNYPRLGIARIINLARSGLIEEAKGLFEYLSENTSGQQACNTWKAELEINEVRLSIFSDNDFDSEKMDHLNDVLNVDLSTAPELYAVATGILCEGCYRSGRYQEARDVGVRGLTLCDHYNVPYTKSYIYVMTSMAEYRLGNLHEAISLAERMQAHVDMAFSEIASLQDVSAIVLACFYYEAGRFTEAQALLDRPLHEVLNQEGLLEIAAISYMTWANIALQKRDFNEATSTLQRAKDEGARYNFPRLSQMAKCREVCLLSNLNRTEDAQKIISQDDFPHRPAPLSPNLWRDYVTSTAFLAYNHFLQANQEHNESLHYLNAFLCNPGNSQNVPILVRCLCLKLISAIRASSLDNIITAIRHLHLYAIKKGYVAPVSEYHVLSEALKECNSLASLSSNDKRLSNEILESYNHYSELMADPEKSIHLSPRQLQVLQLLADGLSNKEIANELGLAEGTIKSYRKSLYEKLNISIRSQAVARARYFTELMRP